ncbi:hypothetical protein TNCV_3251201 [Trichonephila clavipes]|nr:hypothetical protein TNCV_3251201 [Trichonephila clavipes]
MTLRQTIFIDRVTAEIRERFQQLQNPMQNYAFSRPEVIFPIGPRRRKPTLRHCCGVPNSCPYHPTRFVEWAQNEIAVVPDFHKRILFSDEAHFWLNGYVNKQNCGICSEANPQVYVETPLHPEKLTVWCALWAGGILLQKR